MKMTSRKETPLKVTKSVNPVIKHRVTVEGYKDGLHFKLYVLGRLCRELRLAISDPKLKMVRGIVNLTEYSQDISSFQSAIRGVFGINIPSYVANDFTVVYLLIKTRKNLKLPAYFHARITKGILRRYKTAHVITSSRDVLNATELVPDDLLEETLYPKNIKKHPDDAGFLSACDGGEKV